MTLDRREFLAATAAAAASTSSGLLAQNRTVLRPEDFGAKGDGATNDTAAFQRLGAEVNRRGGGTIALHAGRTYIVGRQSIGPKGHWRADPILELQKLNMPLRILGNGARMRAAPGLRFGTFDPKTGAPTQHPMPYMKAIDLAQCYRGMIWIHDCSAPVEIHDVELDGNVGQLRIGGKWGDTGWQVAANGLFLVNNHSSELIHNVYTHHHGTDGAMFVGDPARSGRTTASRLISRYNGRQGLSVTGGHGYDFADCEFSHSTRGPIKSAPGAGVDIENEGAGILRDLSFTRCKFVDNGGCGLVADSGKSEGARFDDCLFVGTTSWSAWPSKPGFSFANCTFVGSVVHAFPDADPARAAHFTHCRFTDDPRLSPTGKVYVGGGPIVNLAKSENVLFDGCTFSLIGNGLLPWSWKAVYKDCTMRQRSPKGATPKGRFLGHTSIIAPVDLNGSLVEGTLVVNGREMPRGPLGDIRQNW